MKTYKRALSAAASRRCEYAMRPRCRCRCKGVLHGVQAHSAFLDRSNEVLKAERQITENQLGAILCDMGYPVPVQLELKEVSDEGDLYRA